MKILLVQESDWLDRNPHQQHHLMDRMSLRGHEVKVIDYPIDWNNEKSKGLIFHREVHNNVSKINDNANIQVIRPSFIKIPGFSYISLFFSHKWEIEKEIKEFKPDIIVGLGILNTYNASKLAKKYNIPFVYYLIDVLYTIIPEKVFQSLGKNVTKRAIANSDLIITINKKLNELAISLGANENKTMVIDAGIDLKKYDPSLNDHAIREEWNINSDDIVLFFMGWIYTFAGIKELAIDLAKNKEKYPKMKLLIIGDGAAFNDLKNIKKDYDLGDRLILTGKQPYTKVSEFLASADFCLLPAYKNEVVMQDIVPIKVYEYMAMEKPVIATKFPGLYKEFGDNKGIIYIDGAEEVLKTVSSIINENKAKEIGKIARKTVENNDWEIITNIFESTLEKLIENK